MGRVSPASPWMDLDCASVSRGRVRNRARWEASGLSEAAATSTSSARRVATSNCQNLAWQRDRIVNAMLYHTSARIFRFHPHRLPSTGGAALGRVVAEAALGGAAAEALAACPCPAPAGRLAALATASLGTAGGTAFPEALLLLLLFPPPAAAAAAAALVAALTFLCMRAKDFAICSKSGRVSACLCQQE